MFLRIISTLGHLMARYFSVKMYVAFIILACSYHTSHAQANNHSNPATNNLNNAANTNIGRIKPTFDANLSNKVHETSGLLWWNNQVWTHNDSGGEPALYAIDTTTGKVLKKVTITNATNVDWEDLTQDDDYIYIGDFGNNEHGNRKDLKVYKVKKSDVKSKTAVEAAVIHFSYNDQTNFAATGADNTNFDCEAIIAYGDSLFLFSKDWVDNKTRLYKLPKLAGTYTATNIGELNVHGLVTGATIIPDKKVIVLTGYNSLLMPFVYLLYDFTGDRFFAANKRKIGIRQSFLQVEGICPVTDTNFYISNERLKKLINKPAKLQTINLAALLNPYYATLSPKTIPIAKNNAKHSFRTNSLHANK